MIMAYKIHIKVISVRHLLTLRLATLVMTYGDGHLNQVSILKNKKFMAYLRFTTSYIWRPCWFSILGGRWEYFTILFEILTDENMGIDTKTKSLDSLIRNIFVSE